MIRSFLVYRTVVEQGSFTRAGEKLFLTQSSVSRIIEALEEEYGVRLLDRTTKSVRPTAAGKIVYHYAVSALTRDSETRQQLRELRDEPAGLLNIGAGFTYGEYILPHAIAAFIRRYPLVQPKITIMNSGRIARRVSEGILHLGIVEGDITVDGIIRMPFAEDELVVVVPPQHRLAQTPEIGLADLANEPWILRESGSAIRQIVDRVFSDHHIAPNLLMEFGSSQIIKASVIAGLGIAMMSDWSIRSEVRQGLLVPLRLQNYPVASNFCCVIAASEFRPKVVTVFRDFLTEFRIPESSHV